MIPKVFAHRGANADAPENTMAAFQLALEQGADGIELDVMLSKDHEIVVIHDDSVDRTTNGTGQVQDLTLAELKTWMPAMVNRSRPWMKFLPNLGINFRSILN